MWRRLGCHLDMKWRLTVLNIVVSVVAGIVWMRLAYWQVLAADELRQQAAGQRLTVVQIPGQRGEILASDGFPLAANRSNYLLYANPQKVQLTDKWSELSHLLPASDEAKLTEKLSWTQLGWVSLTEQVSPQNKDLIEKLNLPGLGFEPRPMRFYPEGSSSAQLLGFVGRDAVGKAQGYFGLEGYYDRQLAGKSGKVVMEKDALGRPIVISGQELFPAADGQPVRTSIDRTLQYILAVKLAQGLSRYGGSAGTITLMNPATGQILAMVSLPNYDPSQYQQADAALFSNPVVADAYEPGSTFKIVTMAAALDAGVVKPESICDMCGSPVQIGEYSIRTWNDKYYPRSSVTEVLVHSDNVGMVWVVKQLGLDKFIQYLHKFGIGVQTGIDLQDESSPVLRSGRAWSEIDLATAAFGQGIAVTPIQMLRAAAVIANGGKLIDPSVAKKDLATGRQVISEIAAAQMTAMMVKAVEDGEAKWAKPAGYTVAGKTGTAQIPVAGHYDSQKTIASFVGFAPAINPKFVMLVTIKEPQSSPWGSETAAPLWFDVAKELWRYFQIAPDKQV